MKWLLLAFLLIGCSANKRALKQLAKAKAHIEKARTLDPSIDTIFQAEVIYMPSRADTVFLRDTVNAIDTVVVENERMRIQYVNRYDTIQLEGECFIDTVKVEVPVIQPTKVVKRTVKVIPWWVYAVGAFLVMIIIRLVFK